MNLSASKVQCSLMENNVKLDVGCNILWIQ